MESNYKELRDDELVDIEHFMEAAGGMIEAAPELLQLYLGQANEILGGLTTAVQSFETCQVEHLAHKLAGSSAACGVFGLVTPLRELERRAHTQELSPADATDLLAEAGRRLERVDARLSSYCRDLQEGAAQVP